MRRALLKAPFLLAIAALFAAGAGLHRLWPRDARADASSSAATIYVPWEGLIFRTPDGKAIARLSRDGHGGLLELYDDRQEAAARLSGGGLGASRPAAREPYSLDDDDPWTAPKAHRPPVRF